MLIQTIVDAAPDARASFQLQHRYMAGLRFNGIWQYQVQTRAGQWRWRAIDLWEPFSNETRELDPQGAWWCVRQRSAFMGRRSRANHQPHKQLPPCPNLNEMLQVMPICCKVWELNAEYMEGTLCSYIDDLVATIERQGCALLRFEATASTSEPSHVRWVWMVGAETRLSDNSLSALLVVGPHWSAPWGSGFGAKAQPLPGGSWRICSVDGEVMRGRLTAAITVEPAAVEPLATY